MFLDCAKCGKEFHVLPADPVPLEPDQDEDVLCFKCWKMSANPENTDTEDAPGESQEPRNNS